MNRWTYYPLALALLLYGGLRWLANLFSLPGNWLVVGRAALFVSRS